MTFLTQTDVDPNTIISVLRQGHSHFTNESDKKILETILKNFESEDFSLLTTQEIQYLQRNTQ